jgi:hypothetical protein
MNNASSQSFNVDDIRRIRDAADERYSNMTWDEIARDIHEGAKEGLKILEELKRMQKSQQ